MSFLDALQGENLAVFEKYLSTVSFPTNSCIINQGDPGDGCYIIDEGTVRLELRSTETDTDSVLCFLEAGSFLGEFSLLDGKPRSSSAYAHTAIKARWFSKKNYDDICLNHPKIGLIISTALGQNLTAKLRELDSRIANYIFANEIDKDTHQMVANAVKAQKSFAEWPENRIDALLKDIMESMAEQAQKFAEINVAETGIGNVEDKILKIRFACHEVYKTMAGHPAAGLLKFDNQTKVTEIANPVGVILALIPVTNPISTVVFKALIALKGRNAVILSCHRDALGVGTQATEAIRDILERHGAPKDLIQTIQKQSSFKKTLMFMNHPDVSFILATGGASMVKAAYSSGKPAIGVGPGNAPVLICADADLSKTAKLIIQSKSFDNGVICGSENNLIVVESIHDEFIKMLENHGATILTPDEKNRFTTQFFDPNNHAINRKLIGKSAQFIADYTGIDHTKNTKVIVVPIKQNELNDPYAHEKLCPVLSLCTVKNEDQGIQVCKQILANQGRGHTAAIHTNNEKLIQRFGLEIEASRILVRAGAAQGCVGLGTGLIPSFTLGCGTFSGNSTTDNVGYKHLLNIKRLALGTSI